MMEDYGHYSDLFLARFVYVHLQGEPHRVHARYTLHQAANAGILSFEKNDPSS
jgi:hypothetical protein